MDIFDAFDTTVTFDKPNRRVELATTVTAELIPALERNRPPQRRSGDISIAGARFVPESDAR